VAVPVDPLGTQEWLQVELVNDVQHEPGKMIGGQPVSQAWGEQEGLVAVAAQEVVGYGACYRFAAFIQTRIIC
jgi:hypothetical protein